MERQIMLDGTIVPVGPHRDDIIETEDGEFIRYGDIEYEDCKGRVFSNEEDKDESNADIVAGILDSHSEWLDEYLASEDYGGEYAYLACEDKCRWKDQIGRWLDDNYSDRPKRHSYSRYLDRPLFDGDVRDAIIDGMIDKLDDYEIECSYSLNEYACFSGNGCCVDSFPIGEHEDQIDVNSIPEFADLAGRGELLDALGRYNGDLYLNYEGRDLSGDYPCFYAYTSGGVWHYYFSDDSMERALCAAMIDHCERADGGKFGK